MFKLLTLSCLLAANVQCKNIPSPAVPYYPQPYQPSYPQGYPLIYPAQLKYNVQPTYGAPSSYPTAGYRQVLVPAIPTYNPYYYGYVPNPVYPQPYPYPYAPANDGTQTPSPAAQPGWGEYLSSNFWNYVPNFPSFGASEQTSEIGTSSSSAGETASTAAEASPGKGDKQTEGQNTEQKPVSDGQPAEQAPFKQLAPAFQFGSFGQPQLYSQLPYIPAVYDPSKINAAKNGAVSSFLFRNQPHPQVFQQPQLLADQKYLQVPLLQSNQGTASLAYQKYLQYQQPFQQQQDQSFHQQQYDQQHQHEEPSVVVDSNAKEAEFNAEGQQQAQPKLATGSN